MSQSSCSKRQWGEVGWRRCPRGAIALIPACRTGARVEERMADHGQVEYATAQGNDIPAHVAMYDRVVHLVVVGVAGHWLLAFAIFVIATLVAAHGFLSGARLPSLVMVVVSLIALALASG